jgi:hypothetical protein
MTVSKNHAGALIISDIVGGYYVQRVYIGYTKREAMRKFRAEMRAK